MRFPIGLSVLCLILLPQISISADDGYVLKTSAAAGKFQHVRVLLEVNGKLKLNADGSNITKLPIKVKAEMRYDERLLVDTPERRRHARYYHKAEAAIQIQQRRKLNKLPDERRLMIAQQGTESLTLFSPLGPLPREALDLVELPGSSAVLAQLLPNKRVHIGDIWKNDDATIGKLLGLEAVMQNDLQSTFRKAEGHVVIIKMNGSVSGAVGGVSTDLEVQAVYNFDSELSQITWFAMSIKEQRAIGHAEPGVDATSRIRVALQPIEKSAPLGDAALAGLPVELDDGSKLVEFSSTEGAFRFVHARGWKLMVDRHDVAVLRLIDRGDLIAQCNASNLPPLKPGQSVELSAFQADIKRALGDKFGRFVEATEGETEQGLRMLRAVVSGVVRELPIHWTYYHLSNKLGRQVSLVFALDARLVERFAESDQMIVSSLRMVDPPTSSIEPPGRQIRATSRTTTKEVSLQPGR